MREIRTEIEINASSDVVWDILMDFDKWKEWNPIVNQANGNATLGSELSITMSGGEGKDGQKYIATITHLEESSYFRWQAKMMAGFLFTNDKVFKLEENTSGTKLIHIEAFSGILVSLFWSKLNKHVPSMLKSMNEALKLQAEKSLD